MAQSSGKVGTQEQKESFDHAEFRDDRGAFSYKVASDYQFSYPTGSQRNRSQEPAALTYFIGSGAAQTFLIDDFSSLFRSPVTYAVNPAS